jgi:hypothetical protein
LECLLDWEQESLELIERLLFLCRMMRIILRDTEEGTEIGLRNDSIEIVNIETQVEEIGMAMEDDDTITVE